MYVRCQLLDPFQKEVIIMTRHWLDDTQIYISDVRDQKEVSTMKFHQCGRHHQD